MITARRLCISLLTFLLLASAVNAEETKKHWLFPHHPRLRRVTKAVGFGAGTGVVLGPALGAGAATGALAGAAEHGTVRAAKDKHDLKHKGKLDNHIW